MSLEREDPGDQRFTMLKYCAGNGHQLINVFKDIGVSGASKPLGRLGFSKAIEALRAKRADGLMVEERPRKPS